MSNGDAFCKSYFVSESLMNLFPGLALVAPGVTSAWKNSSVKLGDDCRTLASGYIWRHVDDGDDIVLETAKKRTDFGVVRVPVKTAMCYRIIDDDGMYVFVIAYSQASLDINQEKIHYISNIASAAYIAVFSFKDSEIVDAELDIKDFAPRAITPWGSTHDGDRVLTDEEISMGVWSLGNSNNSMADSNARTANEQTNGNKVINGKAIVEIIPTWEPVDVYNFPVAEIPPILSSTEYLKFDEFQNVKHIADGSNSNVYTARFRGQDIVIKMISEKAQYQPVAVHEFDVEHGILGRVSHPNIIKLVGAGREPRRFVALEYLGGGTLFSVLGENVQKSGLAKKIFRRSTFTYTNLLKMAKNIADALNYLHTGVHPDATFIHRDIKPDNIGFTAEGEVKLIDFGLCTLVRRRVNATDTYKMTGNTGSLRYMAPEVALRQEYSEKADVYSYGILVWQMARDKVPFVGMNKDEFLRRVVRGGERPKLDKTWNKEFCDLLTSCWNGDQFQRPSFENVLFQLNNLILQAEGKTPKRRSVMSKGHAAQSTWF